MLCGGGGKCGGGVLTVLNKVTKKTSLATRCHLIGDLDLETLAPKEL